MPRIFVIAGHGAGDSGACGNGYQEQERVRALANRIGELGGSSVTVGDMSRNWYADGGINGLTLPNDYQIVELHMDSSDSPSAKGAHVLIKPGFSPDGYDSALADFISGYFPGRSEKIRNQALSNATRAANKGYGYRLVECGFITNSDDVSKFNNGIDAIATGILSCFGIGATATGNEPSSPVNDSGLYYRVHVQDMGWLDPVHDGQIAGTVGKGKRVEALKVSPPEGLVINAKAHIQNVGWVEYDGIRKGESSGTGSSSNDPIIGTVGKSQRIEALEFDVAENETGKELWYQVHCQDAGWTGWMKAGFSTGSVGFSKRVEAVQMKLV